MRLYSLANAGAIDDPVHGHFEPGKDHGGFDLPDDLADRLHSTHYRRRPAWETEVERAERLHGEESARRRDPETLYNAVADIANLTRQFSGLQSGGQPSADVAALTEQVKLLTARLAAVEGQPPEDGEPPAKPSRSRRTAAGP